MVEDHELFQKALAERLRTLRKERGFSLRDMNVRFGYAESQWKRVEREGVGTTQSLLRIAKAFQTTVADLLDGLGQYTLSRESGKAEPASKPEHEAGLREGAPAPKVASWSESSAAIKRTDRPRENVGPEVPGQAKQKFAD